MTRQKQEDGSGLTREYPEAPVAAVGVVVVRDDGRLLLVRRASPPAEGLWSLPGGRVELGETVAEAAQREVREESGVECEPLEVFHAVDRIFRDEQGRVRYHYVIVEVLARWLSGDPTPATDVSAVAWYSLDDFQDLDITQGVVEVASALLTRIQPGR